MTINNTLRATFNGISFAGTKIPYRLADKYNLTGAYKLDFPKNPLTGAPKLDISLINGTYKGFIEVVVQNNDTTMQSFHMDGYSFFVVG